MSTAVADDKGVVSACPRCGQKNRVAFARLGQTGQCGKCGQDLTPMSAPVDVGSAARFDRLVGESPLPVVVDYWAPWCGPCRAVAPELEKVAREGAGQFVMAKVNTEAVPALAERFQIRSIPTMGVYVGGREAARAAGARPAAAILSFIREAVGAGQTG